MADLNIDLTLIGGPTLLIELSGFRLLTDPTFDPPGSYDLGAITLVKNVGPALLPGELGQIDAVLLSHDQHADNLDKAGRAFLPAARATFTTSVGAARLGSGPVGLTPWKTEELQNERGQKLLITGTPARHGPPGIEPLLGEVTGFLVGLDQPGDALYISGDTVWFEGVKAVSQRYRPRLIVLFTGSAQPRGAFHVTMDANDAIEAATAFAGARVVAVHNHGWGHFKEGPQALFNAFSMLGLGSRFRQLEPGVPRRLIL